MSAATQPDPRAAPPLRIMAATDLGPVGETAILVAHARASESGGKLAVCHVITEHFDDPEAAARRAVEVHQELSDLLRRSFGAAADQIEVFVPVGEPAQQIDDCVSAWQADVVVVGRPDNPGGVLARLFRPNVVDKVVRHMPCSVLVTRHSPGTSRLVVGTDFSDPSLPALRAAAAEQQRSGASVTAVHCVPPNAMMPLGNTVGGGALSATPWDVLEAAMVARLEAACADAGVRAAPRIVFDAPANGLIEVARELSADLLIVGTHGRTGLARLVLGSVAAQVVNDAPCPVLVVRLQ